MQNIKAETALDSLTKKCHDHGLKMTPQRSVIYRELIKATDHPCINVILRRVRKTLPNISFDTVYRTVLSFTESGIIDTIDGYGGLRRFDGNTEQHYHFKCLKCQRIIDFSSNYYDGINIPEDVQRQFKVLRQKISLEGICSWCSKKR